MTQLADAPMTTTAAIPTSFDPVGHYRAAFARIAGTAGALTELRRTALEQFARQGFPTRKQEEWRFTDVSALAALPFELAPSTNDPATADLVKSIRFGDEALSELVFINGHYQPQLSKLGKLPAGAKVLTLADAVAANEPGIHANLAKQADVAHDPFAALNTAFAQDGVYVFVPKNVTVEGPIHVLFLTVGSGAVITHPRLLVVAEENAEVSVVETYAGTGKYFTNAVTEFVVAADARVDHVKVQQESLTAAHLSTSRAHLGAKAQFVSHSATLGGLLTRNDLGCTLSGEYADATINGLVLLDGDRHCDNHTLLDHAAANCPSHELYKHVLNGNSTAVFKGKILVRPDSQKTDSKQSTKTLLLSDDAQMNSMPALEIYADDVKCTHGSTVGPMDEEQIFYLRSRGVAHEAAKHLMTYAFAADITRRIRVAPARARIENHMAAQHGLPLDLRITHLGGHDEAVTNI